MRTRRVTTTGNTGDRSPVTFGLLVLISALSRHFGAALHVVPSNFRLVVTRLIHTTGNMRTRLLKCIFQPNHGGAHPTTEVSVATFLKRPDIGKTCADHKHILRHSIKAKRISTTRLDSGFDF